MQLTEIHIRVSVDEPAGSVPPPIAHEATKAQGEAAIALWEDWWTGASRNHVMFCDFAAWAIEFLSILNNDPTP